MNNRITKCTNANVYLNGISYMGRAEEITLPDVQPEKTDFKAVKKKQLPARLRKMIARIKWNAIYPDIMKMTQTTIRPVTLMVRASVETGEKDTHINLEPAVIFLTGTWKKMDIIAFKSPNTGVIENELSIIAYKMNINGEEIIHVDVLAPMWHINGGDQF